MHQSAESQGQAWEEVAQTAYFPPSFLVPTRNIIQQNINPQNKIKFK